uniref:Putative salivary secreted protein n=1 Tax=Ornithodoros turicata TaxID=34597 RepID=A0A2R5L448_9ACAR
MKRSSSVILYLSLSCIFHVSAGAAVYGNCTDIEGHHYELPGKGRKTDHEGCIIVNDHSDPCQYACYMPYVPRKEVLRWRNKPEGAWCPIYVNRGTSIRQDVVMTPGGCRDGHCKYN